MTKFFIYLGCLFLLVACQEQVAEQTDGKALKEIKIEKGSISNADIIRNPVTASKPVDTVNVAKMEFDNIRHRYGEVEEGAIVTHTFKFKNTGKAPLIISHAKSTCGCTVPEWPKEPIPVGGISEIFVKFDTKKKEAYQTKPIFIQANTHPSETTLYLMGKVRKKVE
ncbi:MAG: DUF1573 domain-containing protein [Saprospiraceae bacterium]